MITLLKIWENLSQELNYNIMFSQRGVMNLAHNQHDVRELKRRTHANRLNGIDCEWLDVEQVKKFCPIINCSPEHSLSSYGKHFTKKSWYSKT